MKIGFVLKTIISSTMNAEKLADIIARGRFTTNKEKGRRLVTRADTGVYTSYISQH